MSLAAQLGAAAVETELMVKLSQDSQLSDAALRALAAGVRMSPLDFAKAAYADPPKFVALVKKAAVPGVQTAKAGGSALLSALRKLSGAGSNGSMVKRIGAGGALAGAGAAGASLGGGPGPPPPNPEQLAAPASEAAKPAPAAPGGGAPSSDMPKAPSGSMLMPGAVGAGAGIGLASLLRKKPREGEPKPGMVRKMMIPGALGAAGGIALQQGLKQACDRLVKNRRKVAADKFLGFLDAIVPGMATEKTASVRVLQAQIASGRGVVDAIKVAYPTLTGPQRGILAMELATQATAWAKQAESRMMGGKSVKIQDRSETTVPFGKGGKLGKPAKLMAEMSK